MGMFIVVPQKSGETILEAIKRELPNDYYVLTSGESLVSFSGTTKELSDRLGITSGESGTGLVLSITNYYGRAPTDIWEWMKVKMERS